MEIKEVRVGNLILNHDTIDIVSIWHLQVLNSEDDNYFMPIHISEEILLKVGFKETKNLVGVRASYTFRGIRVSLSNSGHWYFKQRIIYLHDLQNIVFALYGKELEVNL